MNRYALMHTSISFSVLNRFASFPKIIADGNATSYVTKRASSKPVESSPSAEP